MIDLDKTKKIYENLKKRKDKPISEQTLRNYKWVFNKLEGLNLPQDISYIAMQALAGTDNPQMWLDKAKNNGWDSQRIIKEIKSFKGK